MDSYAKVSGDKVIKQSSTLMSKIVRYREHGHILNCVFKRNYYMKPKLFGFIPSLISSSIRGKSLEKANELVIKEMESTLDKKYLELGIVKDFMKYDGISSKNWDDMVDFYYDREFENAKQLKLLVEKSDFDYIYVTKRDMQLLFTEIESTKNLINRDALIFS